MLALKMWLLPGRLDPKLEGQANPASSPSCKHKVEDDDHRHQVWYVA